jgi:hypothetical protein
MNYLKGLNWTDKKNKLGKRIIKRYATEGEYLLWFIAWTKSIII